MFCCLVYKMDGFKRLVTTAISNGSRPLDWKLLYHNAMLNGDREVVEFLSDSGIDEGFGSETIRRSIEHGQKDLVLHLYRKCCQGSKKQMYIDAIFQGACSVGDSRLAKGLLVTGQVDVSKIEEYPLRIASRNGHAKIVKMIMSQSRTVRPDSMDDDALVGAATNGHNDVVRELLKDDRVGRSIGARLALEGASANGHHIVVDTMLRDPRFDPTLGRQEALYAAAKKGHIDTVKVLMNDSRVDPNCRDTSAHDVARHNGHVDTAEYIEEQLKKRAPKSYFWW